MHTHKRSVVGAVCAGMVLGVCALSLYGTYRLSQFIQLTQETEHTLFTSFISRAAEADNVEQTVESGNEVHDCTSRARFETLLSSLTSLRAAERAELDILFAECAGYHAALKSYYVRELREIARAYAYNEQIAGTVRARTPHTTKVQAEFARVVAGEGERAVLMGQQVLLQKELLTLASGKTSARSPDDIARENAHIAERLGVLNAELDATRMRVSTLK